MHTYKCYPSVLSARHSLYSQLTAYACVYIHVDTKCVSCEVIHTWIVVNFQKSPFGCCCMCFISKKHDLLDCTSMVLSPSLLCSKFYLLYFWVVLKVTYYAWHYAHHHCNYATVHSYIFIIIKDCISIVRLQPVTFYIMLCCSALIYYTLCSILCSWENLHLILHKISMTTIHHK